ncbi:hypothetical protein Rsub_08620 [Raphidocelis subcapitata]|uniref:Uncharacterized protein n=1 Tax=Raphidocelis subcapitata TaxID=307507 RepID=A0A2V0P702_9CHLO|nr:hypothetical protein Rsub_08620 [Raphidocelis subcapitata]|eukprot:GBF95638.1 hypothetical protein Rsub_08620 [Raphidocelis subcapitata]
MAATQRASYGGRCVTKGPGRMLGVLVARDPAPDAAPRVLRAFSGQITECWHVPGWVGPVQSLASGTRRYDEVRRVTEGLSARIKDLKALQQREAEVAAAAAAAADSAAGGGGDGGGAGPVSQGALLRARGAGGGGARGGQQRRGARRRQGAAGRPAPPSPSQRFVSAQLQLLTARRARVSHELMERVQRSYLTSDCAGRELALLEVYRRYASEVEPLPLTKAGSFRGFPAGCGDCAAPKLLHAAARKGWRPLSLVEWFFGAPPGTATPAKPARRVRVRGGGDGSASEGGGDGSSSCADSSSGAEWWIGPCAPDGPADATRQHGRVYGQCEKCKGILGTMLHGLCSADLGG